MPQALEAPGQVVAIEALQLLELLNTLLVIPEDHLLHVSLEESERVLHVLLEDREQLVLLQLGLGGFQQVELVVEEDVGGDLWTPRACHRRHGRHGRHGPRMGRHGRHQLLGLLNRLRDCLWSERLRLGRSLPTLSSPQKLCGPGLLQLRSLHEPRCLLVLEFGSLFELLGPWPMQRMRQQRKAVHFHFNGVCVLRAVLFTSECSAASIP